MFIPTLRLLAVSSALLVLAACSTRSISDSGYKGEGSSYTASAYAYKGELSPYDILGVDLDRPITEEDIARAMAARKPIQVKKGSSIMLVQSGAAIPDSDMVAALERSYSVATFSGVPAFPAGADQKVVQTLPKDQYAKLFRLAAAKGGYETIIVYWGLLEAGTQSGATKAVSWVPFVGASIPDQFQTMRIRLNMAVIDTRTGQWETFAPSAFTDEALSSSRSRAASDQEQVALLKKQAYDGAAEALARKYGG
ncbi:hypothetical protein ACFSM5_21420 [Lacibacterium aquatile]|uniref:Aminopeptidase n=1 Tax=Lacibacterium aquatile TaxID=1168082 RepID=A0ABW5E1I6_9PROT